MKYYSLLLACFLFFQPARAQFLVRGHVVDSETGEPLPAATLQIEGTYRGTIASGEGAYELRVESLPATLVVRHIGYETQRRTLDALSEEAHDFHLQAVAIVIEEVVVTGDDPAVAIMRRVIERKSLWQAALETFEADAYTRIAVSNDTGIVVIVESATAAFWDRDRGMKEVLKGRRETANIELEWTLPAALVMTNLYDDDVRVGGHTLVGVTHPKALELYRFHLEGTRLLDGITVYDIGVEPKSRLTSGFVGRISILDDEYAMIDVELRPNEAFLFPLPVQRYDVIFRQQFSSFGGEFYFPVDFRADTYMDIGVPGIVTLPTIHATQVSRLSDYLVNVSVPDSLFESDAAVLVDSSTVASTTLEEEGLIVPLSAAEERAYASIDSTNRLEMAFAPQGRLGRMMRSSSEDNRSNSWLPAWLDPDTELWYNRVDALHAGLGVTVDAGEHVKLGAGGGWSSGLKGEDQRSYHAVARVSTDGRRNVFLEGKYRAGTALQYDSDHQWRLTNGIVCLLGGNDYFDYYRRRGLALTAGLEIDRRDVTVSVTYLSEEHASLPKTTDYDIAGRKQPLRPNPTVPHGRLHALSARLRIGEKPPLAGVIGENSLEVNAEFSSPDGLGSDFQYSTWSLQASWRQRTFAQRRLLPNTLDLRLEAGMSTGSPPPQRAFIVDVAGSSRQGSVGTLRTRKGFPYTGEAVAALFWEHNFRTIPFEMMNLGSVVQRGWSIIVFGGHARTWPGSRGVFTAPRVHTDGFHHEVGISLSGLFGILRLDFAHRLDTRNWAVGFGAASLF